MSNSRLPGLRKVTKDPRTGVLYHRKDIRHSRDSRSPKEIAKPRSNPSRIPTNSKKAASTLDKDKMPSMETQTESMAAARDEEMHSKLDALANRFDSVEKTSNDYRISLEFSQGQIKDLKEENVVLREALKELTLEVDRNAYAIQKMNGKHENLETSTKRRNLIFEGVPEPQGGRENLHDTICKLLSDMGIVKPIDYDMAYRMGQKPGKYPRHICISFLRQDDRNLVFANRVRLRNSPHLSRVWISEDVTQQTRRDRNVMREVAKEARNQGARSTATPNSVIINDKRYTKETLVDLPPEYAVEKCKMKKMGDTIAYQSEHAPFSNLHPARVRIKRRNYLSSEQAFRHIRATDNNHPNIAARILWTKDPYDLMELDRDMEVTEEWKKKEDFVLFKCIFCKYETNEPLRELLLSTGDLELAEATRSMKWATGASINSTKMKTHTWTGENRQGKHSMKVRDYFKLNADEYEGKADPEPVSDSYLEHLYNEK